MDWEIFPWWKGVSRPVVGMLHLAALPGSPRFGGSVEAIADAMLRDAEALAEGGVHAVMLENFGDAPFFPAQVPRYVVAHMTALACQVRRRFELPLGINVLRNDATAALAVAHASGASFIRVNVLCGARVTDQGLIQAAAHDLLRERAALGAAVRILADVDVKQSAPLAARSMADEVADTLQRGLADGLIVSGSATGKPADLAHLRAAKEAAGKTPVFVGSGVTAETVNTYMPYCEGFIIGSAFKRDGRVDQPVDSARVRSIVAQVR